MAQVTEIISVSPPSAMSPFSFATRWLKKKNKKKQTKQTKLGPPVTPAESTQSTRDGEIDYTNTVPGLGNEKEVKPVALSRRSR